MLYLALPILAYIGYAILHPVTEKKRRFEGSERVLILGASSGIGEGLAYAYAREGARVVLVARRREELERVQTACGVLNAEAEIRTVVADIGSVEDVLAVKQVVEEAGWNGLDTVHIISGLPSTQTLLSLAGISADGGSYTSVAKDGLENVLAESRRCTAVNQDGVALILATFLPLLAKSSQTPLIHLLSSVASTIPAPTRALYSATKGAGLQLFRTVGWEEWQSGVRFLAVLPGTVETGFRRKSSSAGKGAPPSEEPEKRILSVEETVQAIMYHSSLPPSSQPISLPLPGTSYRLPVPWMRMPPNDLVYLPEFPYRYATWLLDTPLVGIIRKAARKKYGLT